MSTFPNSPELIEAGLAVVEADGSRVQIRKGVELSHGRTGRMRLRAWRSSSGHGRACDCDTAAGASR